MRHIAQHSGGTECVHLDVTARRFGDAGGFILLNQLKLICFCRR
jgi:hypothetical protein